ncbi:heterogeneous nuclear ribonucleoprotein U-like protein 2 [Dunckerocampus dactyliophorus]|uniref:heterogeneous nuclear ribonucleoprotein U-like protein 2 n=1 Tax=Dunckerocampus dactyliophorus TaxID=161453 RepID=UPI0024052824|nr:heterogeneous nuclear ribonucleoprotein U-like protein 2 [Dunckerocampus dactyliophorus]
MKLADIKKLKVAELRSRLQEAGLDHRGLKTELVGRLWSSLDHRQSANTDEEDVKRQDDGTTFLTVVTGDLLGPASSSPVDPAAIALADQTTRKYSDSTTQTESEEGLQSPSTDSERPPGGQDEDGQAERSELEPPQTDDRGRAFYEFKEEIRYKRAKPPQAPPAREETEQEDEDTVRLDSYHSHLHFEVGPDGACGQPRFWDRFPLLWSGCRLTHGVSQGSVGYEVRLERMLFSNHAVDGLESRESYGMRIGWSLAHTSLLLGEEAFSFAYDGRARKVSGGVEDNYGETFSEGDIVGCYATFSANGSVQLSFHKNGRLMGVAFSLDASVLRGRALYPHVLCKNCAVRFLLDPTAPPWYRSPPGFIPLAALPAGLRLRNTLGPNSRAQCEVVMMVGLPASGKSHWAKARMRQHPEKHYKLLGTEELLACMMRGARERQMQQAAQCLTQLIQRAAHTPGNYILDQCNILFSAQRYKLQLFADFRHRSVVVVFPSAAEWKRRLSEHQKDGEKIPEIALLKLQVSCSLPEQHSDLLDELQYAELPQEAAGALLQEYKDEARRLLPPVPKVEKKKKYLQKKRPHPHGPLPPHWIRESSLDGWNDTMPHMQAWNPQPRYWNTVYYDQAMYYNSGYEGYW